MEDILVKKKPPLYPCGQDNKTKKINFVLKLVSLRQQTKSALSWIGIKTASLKG